ncbi:MAG TPA: ribonuclease H-like domain-containing protein [Candidatus Binataceae bacterium]|nr:ribonuclease H-like domain-containing protein [Candidatus Binataceae bacterium]
MAFVVFDIETRVNKELLNQVFFADAGIDDEEAYQRFREDLRSRGSDFFPLTLHVPISIAVGDVGEDHVLHAVRNLALDDDYSEERLAREFWDRLESFSGCLVSFNGRTFDLPVLELAAMRWGISAPGYFAGDDSARSRHCPERHLDLYDYLTNYGAAGLRGGLDLLLKLIGLPGKVEMNGAMVQEYFDVGRLDEIHRYCRGDVVQTYFLFLRTELMRGRIDEQTYRAAFAASEHFLNDLHPYRASAALLR